MMSGTLLSFDFGTKSIGVAVGQRITGTAVPLPAIKAQDGTPDWNLIERLLKEWQPDEIIVGLPLNMDGTEQPLTARARKFANRIHGRFGVTVTLHDERLSTVEARSGLFEQGGYRALNKGKVDSASAVIIPKAISSRAIKAAPAPVAAANFVQMSAYLSAARFESRRVADAFSFADQIAHGGRVDE